MEIQSDRKSQKCGLHRRISLPFPCIGVPSPGFQQCVGAYIKRWQICDHVVCWVNGRICIYCTFQAVETESHFLLDCSLFIKERWEHLQNINNYLADFNYVPNEQKCVTIMSSEEKYVTETDALGKFIYTCLNKSAIIILENPSQST